MSKEAMSVEDTMKLALEALKDATLHIWLGDKKGSEANIRAHKAIDVLEVELAKQEQEQDEKRKLLPRCFADYQPNHTHDRKCEWCAVNTECKTGEQPKQEQGEPVGEVILYTGDGFPCAPFHQVKWSDGMMPPVGTKLYTTPYVPTGRQQRTWVNATTWRGLTDEEADEIQRSASYTAKGLLKAIEAKLKAKNFA